MVAFDVIKKIYREGDTSQVELSITTSSLPNRGKRIYCVSNVLSMTCVNSTTEPQRRFERSQGHKKSRVTLLAVHRCAPPHRRETPPLPWAHLSEPRSQCTRNPVSQDLCWTWSARQLQGAATCHNPLAPAPTCAKWHPHPHVACGRQWRIQRLPRSHWPLPVLLIMWPVVWPAGCPVMQLRIFSFTRAPQGVTHIYKKQGKQLVTTASLVFTKTYITNYFINERKTWFYE